MASGLLSSVMSSLRAGSRRGVRDPLEDEKTMAEIERLRQLIAGGNLALPGAAREAATAEKSSSTKPFVDAQNAWNQRQAYYGGNDPVPEGPQPGSNYDQEAYAQSVERMPWTDNNQFAQQEGDAPYAPQGLLGGMRNRLHPDVLPGTDAMAVAGDISGALKAGIESLAYKEPKYQDRAPTSDVIKVPQGPGAAPPSVALPGEDKEQSTPSVRNFTEGNFLVGRQYNQKTGEWEEVSRAPRTAPEEGRGRSQQADIFLLPDGSKVPAEFVPGQGFHYRRGGNLLPLPDDAKPVSRTAGGYLNAPQFLKTRTDLRDETLGLDRLSAYFKTVDSLDVGMSRLADKITANVKTAFGSRDLSPSEINRQVAQGQLQGLLGLFRTDIVGPGVLTEYDAQRVIQALGGDVTSLQSPVVVKKLLQQIYKDKLERAKIFAEEVARNAPVFGMDSMPLDTPSELDGGGQPSAASPGSPVQPSRITSDAEYDALAKGTQFIGPDGKLRVKP